MRPARQELINALFVLVLASLIHAAFEAFNLHFDVRLWALIMMGIAIAVSGYVIFEIALGFMASTEDREKEWLKRVGTPARLELEMGEEGENSIFSRREPARRETGLSPHSWEPCGTKSTKTLSRKAVRSMERVEVRKSTRKFPLIAWQPAQQEVSQRFGG